jgi:hypothetical protein
MVISRLPDRRRARARPARRILVLAFAVGLLLAGTAMAVPPTRDAILNVLGLRGVRIERVTSLPASAGTRLGLGTRIPLADARHAAGFTALEPLRATAAFLAHDMPGGRISLLVGPTLITEFRASVTRVLVKIIGLDTRYRLLISFNEPTQPMRTEAASAGFYSSPWGQHPRIQLLTVAELLAGKRIDMPAGGSQMTQVALPPVPEVTVHPDQLSLGS